MEDTFYYSDKNSTTVRSKDLYQLLSDAMLYGWQKGIQLIEEVSPEMAFKIALKRFSTPHHSGRLRAPFDRFIDRPLVEVGKHRLKLFHFGSNEQRPTVLLVHGWTGRASDFSFFIEPLLKAGYRVIAFDSPAHGESLGEQTNALEVAQIIQDLMELEGPFEAIIGHSFGGFASAIATSLSTKFQGVKLVTIGSPNSLENVIENYAGLLKLSDKVRGYFKQYVEESFDGMSLKDINTAHFIEQGQANALVIHDLKDKMVSYDEKLSMVDQLSSVSHLQTTGLGHSRILFNEDVIHRVLEFLENN